MDIEHWLAFAAASTIVVAIPGPTVLLIVSYALSHGRAAAVPLVAGVALGDLTAMTASLAGLGAILLASSMLFTALKWLGAAYLIFLGLKLWRTRHEDTNPASTAAASGARLFWHAYAVTALNPKSIVFFIAFLPQFLDSAQPLLPQLIVCEVTYLVLGTLNAALYVAQATAARSLFRRPAIRRTIDRAGGSLLIAAGIVGLAWQTDAGTGQH